MMTEEQQKACNCIVNQYAIIWDTNCPIHKPNRCPFCPVKDAELTALREERDGYKFASERNAESLRAGEDEAKHLRAHLGKIVQAAEAQGLGVKCKDNSCDSDLCAALKAVGK